MSGNKKPSRPKAPGNRPSGQTAAQKRLAAQRAMAAASGANAARRRRLLTVLSPVAVVILVAAILVGVKLASGSNSLKSGVKASAAATSVTSEVTGVPASVLDSVGKGSITTPPTSLTGAALTGAS
ncbi:MAG: hypothetical protein J0H43_00745, partial [Actinobacteria bacterium]|nr:hypothetical protein [Actinomycetota bacterium]